MHHDNAKYHDIAWWVGHWLMYYMYDNYNYYTCNIVLLCIYNTSCTVSRLVRIQVQEIKSCSPTFPLLTIIIIDLFLQCEEERAEGWPGPGDNGKLHRGQ